MSSPYIIKGREDISTPQDVELDIVGSAVCLTLVLLDRVGDTLNPKPSALNLVTVIAAYPSMTNRGSIAKLLEQQLLLRNKCFMAQGLGYIPVSLSFCLSECKSWALGQTMGLRPWGFRANAIRCRVMI